MIEFLHRNLGIDLGGGDVCMTEDSADTLDRHTIVQSQDSKAMSGAVHGDMLSETALVHHTMDAFRHRPVFHRREDGLSLLMVSFDDFQGDLSNFTWKGICVLCRRETILIF